MLYADDTIIFGETQKDLQNSLNSLSNYCHEWDLKVNTSKTKIVVFSRGKIRNIPIFHFGDVNIEVVDHYNYLGIVFNYNGNFKKAQKRLYDQANKAMFSLITKARRLSLPIDIQLDLFNTLVMPIMTYGCEVWGFENCQLAEKLHLRFCKIILKCNSSTATCMVLGELGHFPVSNHIKAKIVNYWAKIINMKQHRLNKILYPT